MEKTHTEKSSSFSAREVLPPITTTTRNEKEKEKQEKENKDEEEAKEIDFDSNFDMISGEIDQFLNAISYPKQSKDNQNPTPPEIPNSVEKFLQIVEKEIAKFDSEKDPGKWSRECGESPPLLEALDRVYKLTKALGSFKSDPRYTPLLDQTNSLLIRAMSFLEDEFRSLLEDTDQSKEMKQCEVDCCLLPAAESGIAGGITPAYSSEITTRLNKIANVMISTGYETECCQIFSIVRRSLFEESLTKIGFEKISIDEIQKMNWESLEGEIATWIKACKFCFSISFSTEQNLCESVFSNSPEISASLFGNLIRGIVIQLLNFAEAVAMTKRSAEKLFKFLDMYEALGDQIPAITDLFPGESSLELKSETSSAQCRIGEAAVSIFSDLENSIKSDVGKTPVPGGAVHPLTRYVMNYLKYACEYNDTLEQIFQNHNKSEKSDFSQENRSRFSSQLMAVMDLLDANLDAKSKVYKDLSLSYIFLMNNGRYIMQKIKGSSEIYGLMGDTWCRKRSSDLRNYHKSYTRETWGRLLGCFKEEGLQQGKGGAVSKTVLKERFKSFNAMFEEIHKTQSAWVVSDEQLQSELRVSISAVVVPAYRSFLGRFRQYLDSGRQTEKYVKFGPEELETFIDDLFDGTPASMVKRRT
ncbi:exocyst complex component EXO70C2-like [Tasmannia lanceolata]|uniref:exocyst complex component EXO70C2-like n=1 Tax=Tasmannia lanceolata TaxID=3420 RepID=UPI00406360F7